MKEALRRKAQDSRLQQGGASREKKEKKKIISTQTGSGESTSFSERRAKGKMLGNKRLGHWEAASQVTLFYQGRWPGAECKAAARGHSGESTGSEDRQENDDLGPHENTRCRVHYGAVAAHRGLREGKQGVPRGCG